MNESKPNPCRRCGSEPDICTSVGHLATNRYLIWCSKCTIGGASMRTMEMAITNWNHNNPKCEWKKIDGDSDAHESGCNKKQIDGDCSDFKWCPYCDGRIVFV